jgi:hypothetical protein
MKEVFAHMWEACRKAGLPVGLLPIEVSLVVQPEETRELTVPSLSSAIYGWKLAALRTLARPYVAWKRRPRHPAPLAGDLSASGQRRFPPLPSRHDVAGRGTLE